MDIELIYARRFTYEQCTRQITHACFLSLVVSGQIYSHVYAPNGKKYIVVILAQRPYNSPQGKDFIVKASEIIYKAIVG